MIDSEKFCYKIIIVDDHLLVNDGLKDFLKFNFSNCEIVCQAQNGQILIDFLAKQSADIVLLDISMPVMNGIETLIEMKLLKTKIKVIILTMHDELGILSKIMNFNVDGIVLKSDPLLELKYAIQQVMQNRKFFSASVTNKLFQMDHYSTSNYSLNNSYPILDQVDKTILFLLCQQMSASEISKTIYLSKRTIENRKQKMISKLKLKNQSGLIVYALKNGFYSD